MKYRILKNKNGKYGIQWKRGWWTFWTWEWWYLDSYVREFETQRDAEAWALERIGAEERDRNAKKWEVVK